MFWVQDEEEKKKQEETLVKYVCLIVLSVSMRLTDGILDLWRSPYSRKRNFDDRFVSLSCCCGHLDVEFITDVRFRGSF